METVIKIATNRTLGWGERAKIVGEAWLAAADKGAFAMELQERLAKVMGARLARELVMDGIEAVKPRAPRNPRNPRPQPAAPRRSEIVTHWCLRCGGPMSVTRPGERYCGEC